MNRKAVLLINLGTPDALAPLAVRRYLSEFLNDPRVIDLPTFLRWPLVNLVIIPFRYKKTTAAYAKIWQQEGSPLSINTRGLTQQLATALGEEYHVEYAMRYGNPTIGDVLAKFSDYRTLHVIPLFPQYSSAANGSAIEKLLTELKTQWNVPDVRIINHFYDHPDYVRAYAEVIRENLHDKDYDLLLFSYHGLPERHINKSACIAVCDRVKPCPTMTNANQYCYRGQCYATSRLIAAALQLPAEKYAVAFQSRLGRTPWIKPYTDILLPGLIKQGHQRIAVVCPSFVADCLETLEEVNIRMREQWRALGGESFEFIPCINQSATFVKALVDLIT